jgi:hypothetical protein
MFSVGGPRTNALKKQQECAVRRSRSKLYQLYRQVTLYVKCGLAEHHGSFRIIFFEFPVQIGRPITIESQSSPFGGGFDFKRLRCVRVSV